MNNTIKEEYTLLIGTYTRNESKSQGIYVYNFDPVNATSTYQSVVEVSNPSYFTLSPDHRFVYSVSEGKGEEARVSSFKYLPEKKELVRINSVPAKGDAPCYIIYDKENRFVVTTNYGSARVNVLPVNEDASLDSVSQVISFEGSGPDPQRQKQPHPHCAYFAPDSTYIYVTDLGSDCIHKLRVNPGADKANLLVIGEPESFPVTPGSGPRHLTFHPSGKYGYLINELSGTITVFACTGNGNLEEIQTVVADSAHAAGSADIHVSDDGKFLYASNRLENDGIAIFTIDPETGKLAHIGYQPTGIHPRNFILSPDNRYLLVACRDSNVIQIFLRDAQTGLLEDTGKQIELDQPVCLKWI